MSTSSQVIHDQECYRYLAGVVRGLSREVSRSCGDRDRVESLLEDVNRLRMDCEVPTSGISFTTWVELWKRYRELARRLGAMLNAEASVSRVYASMEEFWADADNQALGASPYTFWDTYEHGRRRQLEKLCARSYGTEAALLLNSGMSAIAVVVGMQNLRLGNVIITGERSYFETTEFLERFVAASGIKIERVPLNDPLRVVTTLSRLKPKLFLFESSTNAPDATVPHQISRWFPASPETLFAIDNSVQSHLTRWFEVSRPEACKLLVLESAVKYLTHECMAGVIYGDEFLVERARAFARSTGQQLQEKAFNYIREAEIEMAERKLLLHSRNVRTFCDELKVSLKCWEHLRTLDSAVADDSEARAVFKRGVGALIFLSLRHAASRNGTSLPRLHKELLSEWSQRVRLSNMNLAIRAGFGWNQTSARVYESSRLNQPDAPSYLRVSVGIEPEPVIRCLARSLLEAAALVTKKRVPEDHHAVF